MSSQASNNSGLNARTIIILVMVIGTALFVFWAATRYFEWKEVDVRSGFSSEAIEHPLLAARRYLQQYDYQTDEITGLDFFANLPPADHAILMQYLPTDLPPSHYNKLTEWINQGGHFVTGLIDVSTNDSPAKEFLDQFNVLTESLEWEYDTDYAQTVTFTYPAGSQPLSIDVDPSYRLQLAGGTEPTMGLKNRDFYNFLQLNSGKGHLTLIADNQLFSNWNIRNADNALLLKRIIATSDASTVWINDTLVSFQGLFSLIWEKYKWIVLVLAALLVLLLRRASVRLGPLEKFPDIQSNNFSQHLRAMAGFHFRHGNSEQLLATTRKNLIKSVSVGATSGNEEIIRKFNTKTSLSNDQIRQALFDNIKSTSALTTVTANLRLLSAETKSGRH